jgi:CheY-like chemotaxis protein
LTNACKHTQKGSIHLRIYTRKAASETYSNGGLGGLPGSLMTPLTDVLVVECEDTGPGIELDKLATLFQPLSDVESSVAYHNKMHNSGLGLYSVANEISSLGGNYGVFPREDLNSSPGSLDHDPISGTVFWFTVPLVEPASRRVSSMGDTDEGLLEPLNGGIKYALAGAKIHDSLSSMSSMESISRPKRPLNKSNMVFPIAKRRQMGHNNISRHPNSPSSHHKHTQPCPEVPSPPMPSSQKPGERSKCVLVIDDSITIRKALSKGFSRLGFKVDEAENGLQGFNLMKAHPYDLVLCDFLMPIMDGIDVAKKIRAWERMSRPWYHQVSTV